MGTITNFHDRRSSINFVDHFLTIVDLFTRSFFNDRRSSIVDRVIILIVDRDLDHQSPIVISIVLLAYISV